MIDNKDTYEDELYFYAGERFHHFKLCENEL